MIQETQRLKNKCYKNLILGKSESWACKSNTYDVLFQFFLIEVTTESKMAAFF